LALAEAAIRAAKSSKPSKADRAIRELFSETSRAASAFLVWSPSGEGRPLGCPEKHRRRQAADIYVARSFEIPKIAIYGPWLQPRSDSYRLALDGEKSKLTKDDRSHFHIEVGRSGYTHLPSRRAREAPNSRNFAMMEIR